MDSFNTPISLHKLGETIRHSLDDGDISAHSPPSDTYDVPGWNCPDTAPQDPHQAAVYEWGCFVAELVMGRPLFTGSEAEVAMQHHSERPRLEDIPSRIRPFVSRALSKDPRIRYESAVDFLERIAASVPPQEPLPPVSVEEKNNSNAAWLGFAALVPLVIFAAERILETAGVRDLAIHRMGALWFAGLFVWGARRTLGFFSQKANGVDAAVIGISLSGVLALADRVTDGLVWAVIAGPTDAGLSAGHFLIVGVGFFLSEWLFHPLLDARGPVVGVAAAGAMIGWLTGQYLHSPMYDFVYLSATANQEYINCASTWLAGLLSINVALSAIGRRGNVPDEVTNES